jgi:hypothetical protein
VVAANNQSITFIPAGAPGARQQPARGGGAAPAWLLLPALGQPAQHEINHERCRQLSRRQQQWPGGV